LIRLHRWQLDEKRRQLTDLEHLLADLNGQSERLDAEVAAEQASAAQSAEGRYAYPGYATGVIDRRENLMRSITEVETSIEGAREEVALAFETLKTYEQAEARELQRAHAQAARREQMRLDEIGLGMYRQRAVNQS
jgi:flagellar export protein FliJ